MKKEYKKPIINIDDFEVTERIAGACASNGDEIVTNAHNAMCVLEWQHYFADKVCEEGDPGEIECLDTVAETEGYFWS